MDKIIPALIIVTFIVVILGFFGLGAAAEWYHYTDCMKVGHTGLYCILDMAR